MNEKLIIIKGITFDSLNPHNFHLKNDYINNILLVAFSTLPFFTDKDNVRILNGFLSKSYVRSTDMVMATNNKFTRGKSYSITWDNFNSIEAIDLSLAIFQSSELPIELIIDIDNNFMEVSHETKESIIKERSNLEERIIRK